MLLWKNIITFCTSVVIADVEDEEVMEDAAPVNWIIKA